MVDFLLGSEWFGWVCVTGLALALAVLVGLEFFQLFEDGEL